MKNPFKLCIIYVWAITYSYNTAFFQIRLAKTPKISNKLFTKGCDYKYIYFIGRFRSFVLNFQKYIQMRLNLE